MVEGRRQPLRHSIPSGAPLPEQSSGEFVATHASVERRGFGAERINQIYGMIA